MLTKTQIPPITPAQLREVAAETDAALTEFPELAEEHAEEIRAARRAVIETKAAIIRLKREIKSADQVGVEALAKARGSGEESDDDSIDQAIGLERRMAQEERALPILEGKVLEVSGAVLAAAVPLWQGRIEGVAAEGERLRATIAEHHAAIHRLQEERRRIGGTVDPLASRKVDAMRFASMARKRAGAPEN